MLAKVLKFMRSRFSRFYVEREDEDEDAGIVFLTTGDYRDSDDLTMGWRLVGALRTEFPATVVELTTHGDRIDIVVRPKGTPAD